MVQRNESEDRCILFRVIRAVNIYSDTTTPTVMNPISHPCVTLRSAGAILLHRVPATIITSDWRGEARNTWDLKTIHISSRKQNQLRGVLLLIGVRGGGGFRVIKNSEQVSLGQAAYLNRKG